MRVLDLFSGIGGFSLGLEWAGMQTVAFCEIEPYCRKVLAKHWPGVPIHEDVRKLDGNEYRGSVELVCGGFPCQPWSLAGKREGTEDDRDLWPDMLRVIREVYPEWVIGENVPGLDDQRFNGLDRVLSDLDAIGYEAVPFEIPACAVNAPHRRNRLWIVAHAQNMQRDGGERDAGIVQRPEAVSEPRDGGGVGDLAHAEGLAPSPGDWRDHEWVTGWDGKARRVKPGIRLLAHGVPGGVDRLRALGNAVVPQVVYQIGRAIINANWLAAGRWDDDQEGEDWDDVKRRLVATAADLGEDLADEMRRRGHL